MFPGKYAVIKREDWINLVEPVAADTGQLADARALLIEDCMVIRFQDIFASPALHEYASQIQTSIEILQSITGKTNDIEIEQMEKVRDVFFEAAEAARKYHTKKVPD